MSTAAVTVTITQITATVITYMTKITAILTSITVVKTVVNNNANNSNIIKNGNNKSNKQQQLGRSAGGGTHTQLLRNLRCGKSTGQKEKKKVSRSNGIIGH